MVLEKIIDIISEQLEIDKSVIKESSTLEEDLGAIEDEFGIELSDDVIEDLSTVGDLAKYVAAHKK